MDFAGLRKLRILTREVILDYTGGLSVNHKGPYKKETRGQREEKEM